MTTSTKSGRREQGPTASREYPSPEQVQEARRTIQDALRTTATNAIDACAWAAHTNRRTWQKWESGEAPMHPATWELMLIKTDRVRAGLEFLPILRPAA